jgi:hypothetical protein
MKCAFYQRRKKNSTSFFFDCSAPFDVKFSISVPQMLLLISTFGGFQVLKKPDATRSWELFCSEGEHSSMQFVFLGLQDIA